MRTQPHKKGRKNVSFLPSSSWPPRPHSWHQRRLPSWKEFPPQGEKEWAEWPAPLPFGGTTRRTRFSHPHQRPAELGRDPQMAARVPVSDPQRKKAQCPVACPADENSSFHYQRNQGPAQSPLGCHPQVFVFADTSHLSHSSLPWPLPPQQKPGTLCGCVPG